MQEVELVEIGNEAIDHYEKLYKKKYLILPMYPNDGGRIALRQLVRNHGLLTVRQLLEQFFEMDDPYFVRKGHSLDTFRSELSAIQAQRGSKLRSAPAQSTGGGLRMKWWTWCAEPKCNGPQFEITGTLEELERRHGR